MIIHIFKSGVHEFLLLACLWLGFGTGLVNAQNTVGVTHSHQTGQEAGTDHTVADLQESLQLRQG